MNQPKAQEQAVTAPITRRQREVLDHLSARAAFSSERASSVFGSDERTAERLAEIGAINKRYTDQGAVYWVRGQTEAATGTSVPAGFVVVLHRDVTTPSGRVAENFFLVRAAYDGKGTTFRHLLRGWMRTLGLRSKDLLGGYMGFELIAADSPVFDGDHVVLDALHGASEA
jgi:hypothetical protein